MYLVNVCTWDCITLKQSEKSQECQKYGPLRIWDTVLEFMRTEIQLVENIFKNWPSPFCVNCHVWKISIQNVTVNVTPKFAMKARGGVWQFLYLLNHPGAHIWRQYRINTHWLATFVTVAVLWDEFWQKTAAFSSRMCPNKLWILISSSGYILLPEGSNLARYLFIY